MLLKDVFDEPFVLELGALIAKELPRFSLKGFRESVLNEQWQSLELKARARHVTMTLGAMLPSEYQRAVSILMNVAPSFSGLPAMVFPDFVQVYGLDDVERSIDALAHFTPLFSSEFAIRPFLERYGTPIERQMNVWSEHDDHHLRRLASEGMRPRLPWAPPLRAYIANPAPIVPILERLKSDDSEYVRTSVANNVNDISKDHPGMVLDLVRRWSTNPDVPSVLLRRASRTMLRRGDLAFLDVFQEQPNSMLICEAFAVSPPRVAIGDAVTLHVRITNNSGVLTTLRLEFAITYAKADGRTSRKVFAWRRESLAGGASRTYSRRFRFAHYSTRRQYVGVHGVETIVNGEVRASASVTVE